MEFINLSILSNTGKGKEEQRGRRQKKLYNKEGKGSSFSIIKENLYFKSVTSFRSLSKPWFSIVAYKKVSPKLIERISKKSGVESLFVEGENRPLQTRSKIKIEELEKNKKQSWKQDLHHNEYFISKRDLLNDQNEIIATAIVASSIENEKSKNNKIIINIIISLVLFGFASLIVLNILVSKVLLAPISELKYRAREIANGELDTDINCIGSDEIAELASNFALLRDSVKNKIEELNQIKEGLEKTIVARTLEVTSKNHELEGRLIEIKKLQESLISQDKMASFGVLTAGVAHEIKNPLSIIKMSINIVQKSLSSLLNFFEKDLKNPTSDKVKVLVESLVRPTGFIETHSRRIGEIVQHLLGTTSILKGDFEKTNMIRLIDQYFNLSYHSMRGTNPIEVKVEKKYNKIDLIFINPTQISRVFANLFDNAFNALGVKKKEGLPDYVAKLKIEVLDMENEVEVLIFDNGVGISEKILPKIFDPFFTTKSGTQGAGLGLYVCYDIMKEHEGRITVNSVKNEFTEFSIIFKKEKFHQRKLNEKIHMCLVDDEEAACEIMMLYFMDEAHSNKFEISLAYSGHDCLNFLRSKKGAGTKIIITDLNMPGMDGFSLLETVRDEFGHIKTCVMSAYDDLEKMEKAQSLGALKYFVKPFDLEEIKKSIESIAS